MDALGAAGDRAATKVPRVAWQLSCPASYIAGGGGGGGADSVGEQPMTDRRSCWSTDDRRWVEAQGMHCAFFPRGCTAHAAAPTAAAPAPTATQTLQTEGLAALVDDDERRFGAALAQYKSAADSSTAVSAEESDIETEMEADPELIGVGVVARLSARLGKEWGLRSGLL